MSGFASISLSVASAPSRRPSCARYSIASLPGMERISTSSCQRGSPAPCTSSLIQPSRSLPPAIGFASSSAAMAFEASSHEVVFM